LSCWRSRRWRRERRRTRGRATRAPSPPRASPTRPARWLFFFVRPLSTPQHPRRHAPHTNIHTYNPIGKNHDIFFLMSRSLSRSSSSLPASRFGSSERATAKSEAGPPPRARSAARRRPFFSRPLPTASLSRGTGRQSHDTQNERPFPTAAAAPTTLSSDSLRTPRQHRAVVGASPLHSTSFTRRFSPSPSTATRESEWIFWAVQHDPDRGLSPSRSVGGRHGQDTARRVGREEEEQYWLPPAPVRLVLANCRYASCPRLCSPRPARSIPAQLDHHPRPKRGREGISSTTVRPHCRWAASSLGGVDVPSPALSRPSHAPPLPPPPPPPPKKNTTSNNKNSSRRPPDGVQRRHHRRPGRAGGGLNRPFEARRSGSSSTRFVGPPRRRRSQRLVRLHPPRRLGRRPFALWPLRPMDDPARGLAQHPLRDGRHQARRPGP
jgi:hypothetical protein